MKQRTVLLFLILLSLGATAKTLLVGHRGSNIGVENTVEAFRNGAARGYDFLECDLRVTADRQFVICHDTDTKRLGCDREVAEATLAELKADTLRQKRHGEFYTGTICTLAEYLDICRETNIRPIIELKWSTGINSKDFSNIPALLAFLDSVEMSDKCIVMTSMKPCLEEIRRLRPDMELQFLGGKNWRNSIAWCDSLRIHPDIAHDYLSAGAIDTVHRAGLYVNSWTVDPLDRARELQEMGVDIITTNALLPEEVN